MAFVTAAGQVTESVSQSCCAGDVILLPGREVGAFGGEQVSLLKDAPFSLFWGCHLAVCQGMTQESPWPWTRLPLEVEK